MANSCERRSSRRPGLIAVWLMSICRIDMMKSSMRSVFIRRPQVYSLLHISEKNHRGINNSWQNFLSSRLQVFNILRKLKKFLWLVFHPPNLFRKCCFDLWLSLVRRRLEVPLSRKIGCRGSRNFAGSSLQFFSGVLMLVLTIHPLVGSLSRGVGDSRGFYELNDAGMMSLAFGHRKAQLRVQLYGRTYATAGRGLAPSPNRTCT